MSDSSPAGVEAQLRRAEASRHRDPRAFRLIAASMRLQLRLLRRQPFELFTLVTVPLQAIAFIAVLRHAGRPDLDAYGVVAPGLIALWAMALMISGEVIARERDNQSLESLCAAPGRLHQVLIGRVAVVTALSMLGVVLSWLTGFLVFGTSLRIAAPGVMLIALACTGVAAAATALLFSVIFVNSRSPRIFQNAASFPFYLLGGVILPVAAYPEWLQPLSRLVFLSWSADLMRDASTSAVVSGWWWRCAMLLVLAGCAYASARWMLTVTLRRSRQEGRLGLLA